MDAKLGARERFDEKRDSLVALSHRIHAHPELCYEGEKASTWLAESLVDLGFSVEKGICDLPTAFVARAGKGPLHVAICAEYDALPAVGHACGHNIIAASAVGAGLALAKIADEVGLTVSVYGTPAEEGGGGKIKMLRKGAFSGQHVAMMVHPAPVDSWAPKMIAASHFEVHYRGKEAHASAFPELGINAADAMVIAQTAIGLLRQHIRSSDRIHGIVTKGGDAPNIIPAHTTAKYMVRASTLAELEDIQPRVNRCFEAGALATGAKLELKGNDLAYAEVKQHMAIASLYKRNAESLGRVFPDLGDALDRMTGSTDMGNVSLAMPTIHPFIGIDSLPAVNHQPEFTAACITESADRALRDGALALAFTAIDLANDAAMREQLIRARC